MALPKQKRLSSAALGVLVRTKPLAYDEYFSVRATHGRVGGFRCAIIVPTAIESRPAKRNRIRRAYAEAIRLLIRTHVPAQGSQCIVMVRKADLPSAAERRRRILELLMKSDIVSR
ncbi:MAG TPA: ribonuclease P protein component [Candidatus Paceibacterota bacterium]|nr:ribonuclease P protein component [Candidatus Paceibacterota bacterium]